MDEVQAAEVPRASRISAAALLLGASVLLSRVLGYAREALLAYRVGAGASTDAYYAAFQIPDLLNYLLAGGALSIAFIPLYTAHLASGDDSAADHLLSTVLGTLTAVAIVATIALWWFAEPLIALQFPRFDAATQAMTVHLTRIVLPAQVFFIAGGIINATLFAHGRFGAAALAPLIYNGAIIAGGLVVAPRMAAGVEGFAWGALAGSILGPFLAPLLYTAGRVRLRARVAPTDRVFLRYLVVAAPLMFGQSLLTVDEWYLRWFGGLLGAGAVSYLSYARRLMLVPVAVVGQGIAAAALPTLSRLFAEGKTSELNRVVLRTMQTGLALAIIAGAGSFALAHPLVYAVYQRGKFSAADTAAVAGVLGWFCPAVPAWITQQIIVRAFYARRHLAADAAQHRGRHRLDSTLPGARAQRRHRRPGGGVADRHDGQRGGNLALGVLAARRAGAIEFDGYRRPRGVAVRARRVRRALDRRRDTRRDVRRRGESLPRRCVVRRAGGRRDRAGRRRCVARPSEADNRAIRSPLKSHRGDAEARRGLHCFEPPP